jgi:hypothetical protein
MQIPEDYFLHNSNPNSETEANIVEFNNLQPSDGYKNTCCKTDHKVQIFVHYNAKDCTDYNISLNNINRLVCLVAMDCVLWEVWTDVLCHDSWTEHLVVSL